MNKLTKLSIVIRTAIFLVWVPGFYLLLLLLEKGVDSIFTGTVTAATIDNFMMIFGWFILAVGFVLIVVYTLFAKKRERMERGHE